MTAAADPPAAAVASSPEDGGASSPPKLADGIQLLGKYEESGLEESPYVVRRADGQLVQLAPLLYLVIEQLDGTKSYEDVARLVSEKFEKEIGAGDAKLLVEEKLAPLGLLDGGAPTGTEVKREDPLLALKLKTAVVPAGFVRAATTLFYPLFFPPVILGVIAGLVALDIWLFSTHGVAQSFRHLLHQPATLLLIFGLMVLGTFFHEMGHATGCRYGGGKPGVMGAGIYIIWPAFYTDVNDAYRLGRWGRIRTDLGGVYFNAIFCLAVVGVYFMTGFEALLLVIIGQHFQMLQQFMPFLRLDGYYLVSDVTGVPDLFARIGPIVRGLIPGRKADAKVTELKPWVRGVVTLWVLTTIPAIVLVYALLIIHIPRLISTGLESFQQHSGEFSAAMTNGVWSRGGTAVLQMALLILPTVGATYVLTRTAKRVAVGGWRATTGRPALRSAFATGLVGAGFVVAVALWPDADYRPIGPDERGTLFDATRTLAREPTRLAPRTETSPAPIESPSPSPTAVQSAEPAGRIPGEPRTEPGTGTSVEPSATPTGSPTPGP